MSKPFDATAWAKDRSLRIARAKELKAGRTKLKDEGELTAEHTFKPKLSTSKSSRSGVKGSIRRAQPKEGKYRLDDPDIMAGAYQEKIGGACATINAYSRAHDNHLSTSFGTCEKVENDTFSSSLREPNNYNRPKWNSITENEKECLSQTVPLPSQSMRITRDLSLLKKKKKKNVCSKGEGEAQPHRTHQLSSTSSSAMGIVSNRSTPTSQWLISETGGVEEGRYYRRMTPLDNHQQDVILNNRSSSEEFHRGHDDSPNVSNRVSRLPKDNKGHRVAPIENSSKLSSSSFTDKFEMGQQQQEEMGNCRGCGRSFCLSRLKHHERICLHNSRRERKPFNARKMYTTQGTDSGVVMIQQQRLSKVKENQGNSSSTKKKSSEKWRQQSNQLREAIKVSRAVSKAQKEGKSITDLPIRYSEPDPSYVQCPHCSKRFNQMAGERHISKCLSIRAKPKMLMQGSGIGIGLQARKSTTSRGTF
eukprot:113964_1